MAKGVERYTLGCAGYLQVRPGLWAVTLWRGDHEEGLFLQLCPLPVLSRIKQCAELCHLAAVACGGRMASTVQAVAVFSGSGPVRTAVYND